MAYTKRTFKDRIAVGDNKFTVEILPDGRYALTPVPDSVTEAGTDINKVIMDGTEQELFTLDGLVTALQNSKATPADISTAIAAVDAGILTNSKGVEVINITSASYVDSYYVIDKPYKRMFFLSLLIDSSLSGTQNRRYAMGIIDTVNSQVLCYCMYGTSSGYDYTLGTSYVNMSFSGGKARIFQNYSAALTGNLYIMQI